MTLLARWTLDNGLRVLYRQDAAFPLASATLLFPAGSRSEAPSQAGLCSMTVDLLAQGTRRRNARELARVMESVGASLDTQVHEDYSEIGFVAPSAMMDRAFGVMAEMLMEPAFPAEEIVKEKTHVLAGLSSRKDSIFNVAYDALNRAMYGNHAYGRLVEGTTETVRRFQRPNFQAWHSENIGPGQAILSVLGPQSTKDAKEVLEKHLGRWGESRSSSRRHPGENRGPVQLDWVPAFAGMTAKSFRGGDVVLHSNFEQAYLMVAYPAPCATDPDQIPLKVLNTLLGGGMSSRLFVTLREKLGLAYEVSSFYPTRLDRSQWVIYLGLPKEKLETASRKLNDLLIHLAQAGPNAREVHQAKAMIRGAFLMDRQSRRRQAWYAAWWEFLGRGDAYGDEFLAAVDAVTPKQLGELLRRMLAQPRVTVTVIPK